MAERLLPRYPIYVPSRGRWKPMRFRTVRWLLEDDVPFKLVVEPQERDEYAASYGADKLLVLPFSNKGAPAARNWIKQHAIEHTGAARHWQLDDNIGAIERRWKGRRFECDSGVALRVVEDFTDRFENVALSGMNYHMFVPDYVKFAPYYVNRRVYSCTLVLNSIPHRWRGPYNDDTDLCLQVLADGWCTLLVNAFLADKQTTMVSKGGQTPIYVGDGRLKMARCLERWWPGVVTTKRRFGRPQHVVNWYKFDTPLRLKPGLDLATLAEQPDEYGLELRQVAPEIKSPLVRQLLESYSEARAARP